MLKINDARKVHGTPYFLIELGEYFDYAGSVYLKIDPTSEANAFNLTCRRNEVILPNTIVVPLYAELTIKG